MMAESSTRPGWWRTGNASARMVCLGVGLGVAGALVHLLGSMLPTFNPAFMGFYLFYLVVEVPVMGVLGLLVAGAVLVARLAVAETATRDARALVTGIAAFISSSVLVFTLFSLLQMSAVPSAVGFFAGLLVGGVFAAVSYRHPSQA